MNKKNPSVSKIIIHRSSPYFTGKKDDLPQSQKNELSISAQELRVWVSSRKIFSHLFRYHESIMMTHDLRLISKPFLSTLLLFLLSGRKVIRKDSKGVTQNVTISLLFSLFTKMAKDFLKKKKLIRKTEDEIQSISQKSISYNKLDLSKSPIYLRTDFCYGLQSGGSVGHIAGVLNHLNKFTGNPIFITTDLIPTVNPKWESHIVDPDDSFWDFSELPPLHFNQIFYEKAVQLIGNRHPSFIYQRYSLNNFSGIQIARHFHVPFVLEYNGSEIWVNRNWGGSSLKYESLAEKIELLNLKLCSLVVVISQVLKDQLIEKGIAPHKILVNPNGVDTDKYSPWIDGSEVRKRLKLQDKIVVGFIGTFGKWHGAEILAESFGKLLNLYPDLKKRAHLLLIGDGMTMPIVKEILLRWNIFDFTTLTGTIPQEQGPIHLAACDLLISPQVPNPDGSIFFGSPTKLFEYMAMGKGIIASDLAQIGEVLKHNKTAWMVKPGDPQGLMEGIKTLIENESLRAKLGEEARKKAVSEHTWEQHTRKIIESLKERTSADQSSTLWRPA